MPGEYSQATLQAHFESINKRLRMIEEQLVRISETGGFAYTPSWSQVPEEVVALAGEGKQLEAMKRYRELTGANMDQARDVVVGLETPRSAALRAASPPPILSGSMSDRAPRILILSASIGEGHDLPARVLADGIRAVDPRAEVRIQDFLAFIRPILRRIIMDGSQFHSEWGGRMSTSSSSCSPRSGRRSGSPAHSARALGGRGTERAVAAARPDVVVSTYPGATEILGQLRQRGRVRVPVVSAITDLAALRYWAHPAVDLHLITHPESDEEVRAIAPASEIVCVRGLTDPSFNELRDQAEARRALGLPADRRVVLVSGGGWAVGDLAGAAEAAIADGATAVCLCGRNEEVRQALARRFAGDERVVVLGFSDRMAELMAAADVLVHSTAGLTVLGGADGGLSRDLLRLGTATCASTTRPTAGSAWRGWRPTAMSSEVSSPPRSPSPERRTGPSSPSRRPPHSFWAPPRWRAGERGSDSASAITPATAW